MRYDLAAMVGRTRKSRRREVKFRHIALPSTLASDLYASVYASVIASWAKAIPTITAEYERSVSDLTIDAAADISSVVASVEAEISSILISIRVRLERWAKRVEEAQRRKWVANVRQATGLDITAMVGAGDMRAPLGTVIERNVDLVKSVSDQARSRISHAVFDGLNNRRPAREVAADIREAVDLGRRRALNIASDQLSKTAESLNEERRREAGLMTWEWVSSHKVHFRPEHAARDGKRYSDDPADNAPPPEDRPGQLPFCGCTSRAVLSLDSEF